ncbi:hypothetical protein LCGC14_2334810 [marine sediment metagenome]|uniref:Uncharacterized protein n=1 Tax=marine sediment metagenome TaxID=412755 RepID=A0A0F9F8S3_9ZZZZ
MFCIFHQTCSKSVDNGNCSVYPPAGVVSVNKQQRHCCFLPESVYTGEKKKVSVHKRNPIKASKAKVMG